VPETELDVYTWLNEPADWTVEDGALSFSTGLRTDFWQHTFYGFHRDSGHAYLRPVSGDFTFTATVEAAYRDLYDQAGLMLRIDDKNWIKTGIEYTDGLMHFSVVVTRDVSDWSVIPLHDATPGDQVGIRLTRHDDAVRIQYAINGRPWQMARLAPFPAADATCGVMACSPERSGLSVRFADIALSAAISRRLHDD
jgi:hypothetical protein